MKAYRIFAENRKRKSGKARSAVGSDSVDANITNISGKLKAEVVQKFVYVRKKNDSTKKIKYFSHVFKELPALPEYIFSFRCSPGPLCGRNILHCCSSSL